MFVHYTLLKVYDLLPNWHWYHDQCEFYQLISKLQLASSDSKDVILLKATRMCLGFSLEAGERWAWCPCNLTVMRHLVLWSNSSTIDPPGLVGSCYDMVSRIMRRPVPRWRKFSERYHSDQKSSIAMRLALVACNTYLVQIKAFVAISTSWLGEGLVT